MEGRVASEPFTNPDTGRRIFRFELETAGDAPSDLCLRMYLRGDPEPLELIFFELIRLYFMKKKLSSYHFYLTFIIF